MAVLDAGLSLVAAEEIGKPLPSLLALSTTKSGPGWRAPRAILTR
jgi:hypothetical protein